MIIEILKIIAAVGTILTGIFSLVAPRKVQGFTGLTAEGGRGITEIRAILGGVFIGAGLFVLILNTPDVYIMLGAIYLVIAFVRLVSMFIDNSIVKSNVISFITEIILGVILIL